MHLGKEVYKEDRKEALTYMVRNMNLVFVFFWGLLVVSLNFFALCLKWVLFLLFPFKRILSHGMYRRWNFLIFTAKFKVGCLGRCLVAKVVLGKICTGVEVVNVG